MSRQRDDEADDQDDDQDQADPEPFVFEEGGHDGSVRWKRVLVGRQLGVGIRSAALIVQDPAVLDVNDPVGPGFQARVVGHADHGGAVFGGGPAQQADDHLAVFAVERRGRFVGEQDLRVLGQGAGDRDALLLAAGQGVGPLVQTMTQAHFFQRRGGD